MQTFMSPLRTPKTSVEINKKLKELDFALLNLLNDLKVAVLATWRNGYAEDCKSFYSSSILDVASKKLVVLYF